MKTILLAAIFIASLSLVIPAQNDSKQLMGKASERISNGDIRGAIAILDKAVEKNDNLFEVFDMRSTLHRMLGNLKAEFEDLSKAIELKPLEGELYERRAQTRMFLRHDSSLILSDLDSAIAHGRKMEKVYSMRAMFRRQNGDIDGALADLQTAVGLNPESAASNVALASIYEHKGDDAQAVSLLENFLAKSENSLEKPSPVKGKVIAQKDSVLLTDKEKNMVVTGNTIIIADNETKLKRPPTPEEMQKSTYKLEQAKNTALAYAKLASLYEKRGDYKKALETVGKGVEMDPTDTYAIAVRGKIKSSMKDYEGAVEDLSAAIEKMTFPPQNYLERGIALLMLGREAEAQKDFDKYLQIFPQGKSYLEKRLAEVKQKPE